MAMVSGLLTFGGNHSIRMVFYVVRNKKLTFSCNICKNSLKVYFLPIYDRKLVENKYLCYTDSYKQA